MYSGRFVYSQLMEFFPLRAFRQCVQRFRGNYKVQRFSCLDQFLCMAFAQLTGRESLRDIETCLRALQPKLYHVGIRGNVSRTTLAKANENRDWRIYAEFAQVLIGQARKLYAQDDFGVQLEETAYVFDSSTIDLCLSLFPWARFRRRKAAIKLHTLMDLRGNIPCFIRITEGKTHDVNVLDELVLEPGAFYIMDRGYIDFARLYTFTTGRVLCHPRQAQSGLHSAFIACRRQNHRLAQRPAHRTTRTGDLKRLPRCSAPHQLLRRRVGEPVGLPHQSLPSSTLDYRAAVPMPLAGGVVFQVDQAAPAHQGVLRHLRERGEDPDLDRHQHLRARGHRQEATGRRPQSGRNPANPQHLPFRESRYFTTTYEVRPPKRIRPTL